MIGPIEDAMATRVKAASDRDLLGYRLRFVGSYGGELQDANTLVALVRNQLPAVFVRFLRANGTGFGQASTRWAGRFQVIAVTRNARNEAATRKGAGAAEVGSYQVAADVRRILGASQLGLEIDALQPMGIVNPAPLLAQNERFSLCAVEFATSWAEHGPSVQGLDYPETTEEDAPGSEDGALPIDDFDHLHLDWDAPPFGVLQPSPPLPLAPSRDAVDAFHPETGAPIP